MTEKRTQTLLPILFCVGLAWMPYQAGAQDVLGLSSTVALEAGAVVRVPLSFRDFPSTPLDGAAVHGLSVTVVPSPAAAVTAISIERAGVPATVEPRFEVELGLPSRHTWLVSFEDPLPLPSVAQVAVLEVSLDPAIPADTLVTLSLAASTTGVSNVDGSVLETVSSGDLQLVDGVIEVLPSSLVFADGFESGNFLQWTLSVP